MKKIIIAVLTILLLIACGEKKMTKNLQITGNIKDLKEGTLYIQHLENDKMVTLDTIKISGDSHFTAEFDLKSPEMFYLILNRGVTNSIDDRIPFFVEPGKINIDTSLDLFYVNAKITGSKNHDLYRNFNSIFDQYSGQNLSLMELKLNTIKYHKKVSLDSIDAEQDKILKRKYLYAVNFALQNKDYEVAPYVALSQISDINLKYLDTIQKSMAPKVAASLYGKKLISFYNLRKKTEQ